MSLDHKCLCRTGVAFYARLAEDHSQLDLRDISSHFVGILRSL